MVKLAFDSQFRRFVWGLSLTLLGLHSWSLLRYPAPFGDEAWSASRAWGFLHSGCNFGTLDAGVFDRIPGYCAFFPFLPTRILAVVLFFFSAPMILAVRLVSLFFGAVLLIALYAALARFADKRLAWLSVGITATSYAFLNSAHIGRADIIAAALGTIALALYASNVNRRFGLGWLAGLSIGLAVEVHAHGAVYAVMGGALYLADAGRMLLRRRDFWAWVLGGATGAVVYAVLHILPSPQGFLEFNRLAFTSTHTPPLLTLNLRFILDSFVDLVIFWLQLSPALTVLTLCALVALTRDRSRSNTRLVVLGWATLLAFGLLIRNKNFYYAIYLTPTLDLVAAAWVLKTLDTTSSIAPSEKWARTTLWGLCAATATLVLSPVWIGALLLLWGIGVCRSGLACAERGALLLHGIMLLGVTLVLRHHLPDRYSVLFIPALDVAFAALTARIGRCSWLSHPRDYVALALGVGWLAGGVTANLAYLIFDAFADYRQAQAAINQVIVPDDVVLGPQAFWFGLYDHPYYSWEALIYYRRYVPGASVADAFAALRPDIFVMDTDLDNHLSDQPGHSAYGQYLILPRSELESYLVRRATLLTRWYSPRYGEIRVYRLLGDP